MIFDAAKHQWRKEAPLLDHMPDGRSGGFCAHRAVEIKSEDDTIVVCVGGFGDATWTKHPNQMTVFCAHE